MTRLPIQGELAWGDVLNDFLLVQHNGDGTHKLSKLDVGLDKHESADDPHGQANYAIMKGGGRRIFVQATDPALVSSNNVTDGDLWIDTAA